MRSNARSSSKFRDSEEPPTAWRTFSTPSIDRYTKSQRQEKKHPDLKRIPHIVDASYLRVTSTDQYSSRRKPSNEFSLQRHVTRDSTLDDILLSLNHMQEVEGSHAKHPPLYSSFKDGEFKLDTPRFVYDAITHMGSNSQSSSITSSPASIHQDTFNHYQHEHTRIQPSNLVYQQSSGTLRPSSSKKTITEPTKLDPNLHSLTSALVASVSGTPRSYRRTSASMDLGIRVPRELTRRHTSTKSEASTQASQLPANAILSQPGKAPLLDKNDIVQAPVAPLKERPGFLRRVFGPSRSRGRIPLYQPDQLQFGNTSPEILHAKKSNDPLPILHKKSSFFNRRKKRDLHENDSATYSASLESGTAEPISVPGLALTTDDQLISPSWADGLLGGEDHSFEVSHTQNFESILTKPARRIWIQPDEYDRVVQAPIISSSLDPPLNDRSGNGIVPAATRSSALSQALQNMYNQNTVLVQIPVNTIANQGGFLVEQPVVDAPTQATGRLENNHDVAERMYHGCESESGQIAAILGQQTGQGEHLRQAYMDHFDFAHLDVLSALRELCGRLALRAETQQVDRILASFSQRWCQCNPNHEFHSQDVVHTICYSLFLLNTDLHLADHDHKMTKNQFIRNTLPTIRSVMDTEGITESLATKEDLPAVRSGSSMATENKEGRPSLDRGYSEGHLSLRGKVRPASGMSSYINPILDIPITLVNGTTESSMKAWESHTEAVLREFYNSVRQQRLPLSGTFELQGNDHSSNPSPSLRSGSLQRASSIASRDLLETPRSRVPRWTRSKTRPYLTPTAGLGRQSIDEQNPYNYSVPNNWVRSSGRTLTPKSTISLESTRPSSAQQQHSIGFASALGQAMINIHDEPVADEAMRLEEEVLQLAGAPWAKEGIVQHKHQRQATDKKNKDRHWTECFAVVDKGSMRLFSFTSKASVRSQRQKAFKGAVVGGGDWMESAESLENFILVRTIADVLPEGYGPTRPNAFALTLPSGAVQMFQVGTPEIAREFVDTINYWSARSSPQPLSGGVSSIEYGWSDSLLSSVTEPSQSRSSFQSSIRSGFEGANTRGNTRARMPGDRVALADWLPPLAPLQPSMLPEGQQLVALVVYLEEVEGEMQAHSELRSRVRNAYSPAQPNGSKAMVNWERKSAYLLGECTRVMRYIDCLTSARASEEKLRLSRKQ